MPFAKWTLYDSGLQTALIARWPGKIEKGAVTDATVEDVDLVRRVGWRRMALVPIAATTSAVRYRQDGYLLRPMRNLCCLTLYFLGVPPKAIAKLYG